LSAAVVGKAAGISKAEVSRIERALSPKVPLLTVARLGGVVGLDISVRAFAGPAALRDGAHVRLLDGFRALLPASIRWAVEVPLPISGDQRAWDALLSTPDWRYGAEAETRPTDAQAVVRRIALKARDGGVDGVLLVLRDTRTVRLLVREAEGELAAFFRVPARTALARLKEGRDPGRNAIVFVPASSRGPF
jgi:hypothetical protein